jgi:hypothetical protein
MREGAAQAALGEFESKVHICSETSRGQWPWSGRNGDSPQGSAPRLSPTGPGRASILQPSLGMFLDRREQGRQFSCAKQPLCLERHEVVDSLKATGKPTKCKVIAKYRRAAALAEFFDPACVAHLIGRALISGFVARVAGTIALAMPALSPARRRDQSGEQDRAHLRFLTFDRGRSPAGVRPPRNTFGVLNNEFSPLAKRKGVCRPGAKPEPRP